MLAAFYFNLLYHQRKLKTEEVYLRVKWNYGRKYPGNLPKLQKPSFTNRHFLCGLRQKTERWWILFRNSKTNRCLFRLLFSAAFWPFSGHKIFKADGFKIKDNRRNCTGFNCNFNIGHNIPDQISTWYFWKPAAALSGNWILSLTMLLFVSTLNWS